MGGQQSQDKIELLKRQHALQIKTWREKYEALHKHSQAQHETVPSADSIPSSDDPMSDGTDDHVYSMEDKDLKDQKRFYDATGRKLKIDVEAAWQCESIQKDSSPECIPREIERMANIVRCGGNLYHNGSGFSGRPDDPRALTYDQFRSCLKNPKDSFQRA
jgi:hypothetical protein